METSNKLLRSFSCFSYQVKSVLKYHNQDITTGGWPKILNIWKMGKDSVEGNLFFLHKSSLCSMAVWNIELENMLQFLQMVTYLKRVCPAVVMASTSGADMPI